MTNAIEGQGLDKGFAVRVVTVDAFDPAVRQGEIFGFLGSLHWCERDGRILTTSPRPAAGRARVAGVDVLERPNEVRTRMRSPAAIACRKIGPVSLKGLPERSGSAQAGGNGEPPARLARRPWVKLAGSRDREASMRSSRTVFLAAGGALALVLAACGDDEAPSTAETNGGPAAGGEATISVADSQLGPIVVDAEGQTLYAFLPDDQGASTCYDDCAANWPALTVEGDPVAGEGVDPGLVATTEREDGIVQVSYNGWPLYRYAADGAAGDVNGQGVGGVWFVVSPDGVPLRDAAAAVGDEPGGGYGYGSGKG